MPNEKLSLKFSNVSKIPQTLRLHKDAMAEIVKLHNKTNLPYKDLASQLILYAAKNIEVESLRGEVI